MGGSGGGRFIRCDAPDCPETFSLNLSWQHDGLTVSAAKEAGWVEEKSTKGHWCDEHFCPRHSRLANVYKTQRGQ